MTQAKQTSSTRFQVPKGTRDFYPADMNWRRHLESAWRAASIRHGFDEIEGPMFETLDLYKVKSGEGIVSELFAFEDRGGRQLALRPEFTPTLARMVVAKAASLSKPIKWFSIPTHFRAERPQRGRLREFLQWNVDFIGDDSPHSDAEVLGVAIDLLADLGLTREIVRVRLSHREAISKLLLNLGLSERQLIPAFTLLDKRDKITPEEFQQQARAIGLNEDTVRQFDDLAHTNVSAERDWDHIATLFATDSSSKSCDDDEDHALAELKAIHRAVNEAGLAPWCDFDLGIVRGLAYYTGMVFEIHESTGKERAVAGGGRYDRLIESFGGPPLPACGFGMGDVVLSLVLEDHHLKPDPEDLRPTPELFIINATDGDESAQLIPGLLNQMRHAGIHTRRSYKTTRNLGKLLKEAGNQGARYAAVIGREFTERKIIVLKDMDSGIQVEIEPDQLAKAVLQRLGRFGERGLEL